MRSWTIRGFLALLWGLSSVGAYATLSPVACPADQGIYFTTANGRFPSESATTYPGCGTVNPQAKVGLLSAGAQKIAIALDSEKPDGKRLNLLRVNLAGEMHFDAANIIRLVYQGAEISARPASFTYSRDGQTYPVAVETTTFSSDGEEYIFMKLGSALQGTCTFGEKTYPVRLIDSNINLHFGDLFITANDKTSIFGTVGDSICVDVGDGTFANPATQRKAYYGHPLYLNGAWYEVTLNNEQTALQASPFHGPMGTVKLKADHWSALLSGSTYLLQLTDVPGDLQLPADRYALHHWSVPVSASPNGEQPVWLRFDYSTKWRNARLIDVIGDKVATLNLAPTVNGVITCTRQEDKETFSLALKDQDGEAADLYLTRATDESLNFALSAVSFAVVNAAGQVVHSGTFEHG